MATEMTPPLPGDQVGAYTLIDVLGVGGNATVYRASSDAIPIVALKILHPGKIDTNEQRRFRREFLTLQNLRHENIVAVYEFGIHGDYPWIAMEYVDGIDLDSQISNWKAAPNTERFADVERMLCGLAEGLAYIHARGLIHRDLKPSNILLTADGQPKISDFGFVKSENALDTQLTQAGRLVGTVAFMAPEQIMGEAVDSRVDLYSLGAVLYLMLTLEKPIEADTIPGYLARHLTHVPPPPAELDPQIPSHLDQICCALLLKDPTQRTASAQHLLASIREAKAPSRPPIFGRDVLLQGLQLRLQALQDGTGGVVIIEGEHGIGKTIFTRELTARVRAAGQSILWGSGAMEAPLVHLATQLPALGAETSPILRITAMVRQQPLAVIIDDLDAFAHTDLQRLTTMVRDLVAIEGRPLLVIATLTDLRGGPAQFANGAETGLSPERITLTGLDRRSSVALVREQGLTGAAGAALGHRLHEDLRGNPGAILAQLQALVTTGWLAQHDNGLRASKSIDHLRTAALPLPATIRAQREGALSSLSTSARKLLNALVVLNMESTVMLLQRLLGFSAAELERAALMLVEQEMLVRRQEGTAEVFALHPSQQRNLLYALMDPGERSALHRQVAQTLRRRSRRLGAMAEIISHHLLQGGEIAAAWPLLLVAAQRKLRTGQIKAARHLLRLALDAQPAAEANLSTDAITANRRLLFTLEAECREQGGDITGAVSAWTQALAAAQQEGDPKTVARIQAGLGLSQTARGDVLLAGAGLEAALQHLEQGDPMWPRVARALAIARLTSGHIDAAETLWQELLEWSQATDAADIRAEALVGLAQVTLAQGHLQHGLRQLDESIPLLPRQRSDPEHARLNLSAAQLNVCTGRLHRAIQAAEQAEAIARDAQRLMLCVRALSLSAHAHWALGDSEESRRQLRSATAIFDAVEETETVEELRARLSMARIHLLHGHGPTALALLPSTPPALAPGLDDPVGQSIAMRARLLASADPQTAQALLQQLQQRAAPVQTWLAVQCGLDVARARHALGQVTAVEHVTAELTKRLHDSPLKLQQLELTQLCATLTPSPVHDTTHRDLRTSLFVELGAPPGFLQRWS